MSGLPPANSGIVLIRGAPTHLGAHAFPRLGRPLYGLGDAQFPMVSETLEASIVASLRAGDSPESIARKTMVSVEAVYHFAEKHGVYMSSAEEQHADEGGGWFGSLFGGDGTSVISAAGSAGQEIGLSALKKELGLQAPDEKPPPARSASGGSAAAPAAGGLSTGAMIGIGAGAVAFMGLLVAIVASK